jgi:GTP-binding protein
MKIKDATFITSVASADKFYKTDKPIIAVAGKSNVGKSSLINMLANKKKLAKTSVTPGRTRLINYFDFGEFVLADLPGYGFAKVSKEEKKKWGALLETFLSTQNIRLLLSLVDIRHDPTADDKMMVNYLYHYAVPFVLVATKADKLGKTRIYGRVQDIGNYLAIGGASVIATSAETGYNKDKLLDKIEHVLKINADEFFNSLDDDGEED